MAMFQVSFPFRDYFPKYLTDATDCVFAEAQKTLDEYRVAMSNSPDEIAHRHTIAGIKERDYVQPKIASHTEPRSFPLGRLDFCE